MDQMQPATSAAAAVGMVESAHASPAAQGVEHEDSQEDTPRLSQKRPGPTLHQLNRADKRQKIWDQFQAEEIAETTNRSADVNAAAKGKYILMAFWRHAPKCTSVRSRVFLTGEH
jgi:hypothetical protein